MNVRELYQLAMWFEARYPELARLYQELFQPLQHNASQPDKQPLEDKLENLTNFLRSMTFEELSIQQLALLRSLGVDTYIGATGAALVNSTIRTSDFDPATAVTRVQEAIASITNAHQKLIAYRDAVKALDVDLLEFEEPDDFITIRVGFRNHAAIENIVDWKDSGREWYDIIRGLALAADEPPENTRVIGAGTGSIILFLAATATVTTLLAIISKNVTGVAKNVIDIQGEVENLRQKKLLTKVMETEFTKQIEGVKANALDTVMSELKVKLPDLDGEASTALQKSVTKLLAFNEKGGNVDFVTPANEEGETEMGEGSQNPHPALAEARAAIHDYQSVRSELKLLTDASNDD